MKYPWVPVLLLTALACGGAAREETDVAVTSSDQQPTVLPEAQPATPEVRPATPAARPATPEAQLVGPAPVTFVRPERQNLRSGSEQDPGTPQPPAGAGQSRRALWRSRAPTSYVVSACGTGAVRPSCSVDAVNGGHLVASENRLSTEDPWQAAAIDGDRDVIESLFEQLERPLGDCQLSYELDPTYGYPTHVYFDCGQEGWGMRVTCFKPDTLDLDECRQ